MYALHIKLLNTPISHAPADTHSWIRMGKDKYCKCQSMQSESMTATSSLQSDSGLSKNQSKQAGRGFVAIFE